VSYLELEETANEEIIKTVVAIIKTVVAIIKTVVISQTECAGDIFKDCIKK
jgi:hypothetical protein